MSACAWMAQHCVSLKRSGTGAHLAYVKPSPKRDAVRAWVHELNGATFTPRRCSERHSPATTTDLPASDDVPDLVQPVPGGPQTPEI